MGVFTDKMEVTTEIPPAWMIKALVVHYDVLIPKIIAPKPKAIWSVELIEGDGGPGSIKKITFEEGSRVTYVKLKIEAINEKGFSFNYSLIEGDALMNNLEKISHDIKFVAAKRGRSICNMSISKHYSIGDIFIKKEDVKAEKERAMGLFKAAEAYLLPNREARKKKAD